MKNRLVMFDVTLNETFCKLFKVLYYRSPQFTRRGFLNSVERTTKQVQWYIIGFKNVYEFDQAYLQCIGVYIGIYMTSCV